MGRGVGRPAPRACPANGAWSPSRRRSPPSSWPSCWAAPGYREVGRDLARSVRSGLGLAELLRRHALDARADQASRAVARARAAGVRSVVPLMLCFLPAFMLLGVVPLFGALVVQLLP